jgi:hypothetical protein
MRTHEPYISYCQNICLIKVGMIMHYEFRYHEYNINAFSAVSDTCRYEKLATILNSLCENIVLIPLQSFLQFKLWPIFESFYHKNDYTLFAMDMYLRRN